MSEFSSISKKTGFSSCVFSHFFQFCFFLISHPLYLSYFIFFFPYLLKLFSFLSPLFFTTFLLLSPTLFFHYKHHSEKPFMGFLSTTYQIVFDTLLPKTEEGNEIEEIQPLEELEAYKIVFETYTFETGETPYDQDVPEVEVEVEVDFQETLENFPDKIETFPENQEPCKDERKEDENESKALENKIEEFRKSTESSEIFSNSAKSESSPWSSPCSGSFNSLGSYGSMRKEKEWRRTLACKLFEERHNADGIEGMDSLWETYEKTESKALQKNLSSKLKKGKKFEEDDEDGEEEEDRNLQLCCLQALKFSAGKMNLGLRKPNLVKMSKALKGFGFLSRRGSKKSLIH